MLYDDDDDDDDDFEVGSISGCLSLSLADEFFVKVLLNGGPILLARITFGVLILGRKCR